MPLSLPIRLSASGERFYAPNALNTLLLMPDLNTPYPKTSFSGDVLKLISGTTFAQLVSLAASPILTRLYAPEAFGLVTLFASITGILGVIVCMGYELAIMLPERDQEAANLLAVSLGAAFLISLLLIPLVWWWRAPLLKWLNAPSLESYLWLVPIAVFISGVFLALNYWNSRTKQFGRLSIARITISLTTTPLTLGLGFSGYVTAGSMIGASIVGQIVATSVLGKLIWQNDIRFFVKYIRLPVAWTWMKRYKKFLLISTWSAIMNTISVQLPPLLLSTFFSSAIVGFYALGHRLLNIPMSLIGSAVAQVFFQRAAVSKNDDTLPSAVRTTFLSLMALGSFPILLVMITGKDIFYVVFGSRWSEAGVYAQILAPWILFVFLGSPISVLFNVLEMQGTSLLFNLVLLVTRVASLLTGGLTRSIFIALILYSGTGMILWSIFSVYLLKKAGITIYKMAQSSLEIIIILFIVLLPLFALKIYGVEPLYIVISGCLTAILYYTILYFRDMNLQKIVDYFLGKLIRWS
jgi:O-antigen/teichoic acid export membrane protein